MEPKAGRLVKAIYDFPTDDDSELPLQVGDIVQVSQRIDKQWSQGICNKKKGSFPIGFTVELKIPLLGDQEELFAVTNDFSAQQEGDLTIKKGDLVIGKHPIDSNWWYGENHGVGIFPLTHAWKVTKDLLPETTSSRKMFLKARVKMNLKAQIEEEMDLFKDEIVTIMEEVEKGWYRGECNGRRGTFPASFVALLSESSSAQPASADNLDLSATEPQYDNHNGYDCINSGINPYGRTVYPFRAEYANELSFSDGEIVKLNRYVDDNWLEGEIDGKTGIFPASFVSIVVDCPNSNKDKASIFPEDTYGRVTCDLSPQLEGDISLKEGDTVTLIRKIDHNWYEVVTDNGYTGICPESYIEIIGSGPPSYNEVMSSLYDFPTNQESANNNNDVGKTHATCHYDNAIPANLNSFSSQFSSDSLCSSESIANNNDKFRDIKSLDLSALDCGSHSSNNMSGKSWYMNSDTFNDSGIGQDLKIVDESISLRTGGSYQNVQISCNKLPKDSFSNWNNVSAAAKNEPLVRFASETPSRPPPPRNVPPSSKVTPAIHSSADSKRLSCVSVSSQSSSEAAADLVGQNIEEIKSLLQQKEKTLKIRIACKNKIENEKGQHRNNFVSNEMKGQVSHLNEEINQLEEEIVQLKERISKISKNATEESEAREREVAKKKDKELKRREQEKINKMREQRECIITELLQTERDYLSNLKLLHVTFLSDPNEAKEKGINLSLLFGNLEEVIDVATRLLKRLEKVSMNTETKIIGECFVDLCDDMKQVYGHYCRNHDEVTSVIDKIDPQSPAALYLKHKLEVMKRQTNCFDLPAMLIKPVQRILKYPLLLNELLKVTEDCHPDKQWLLKATNLMTDVASAVNEFKRKKDLVFKYRKQADTSLSGRVSKITMHSMAKKTSRFGQRLSSSLGLKTMPKDQDFEKVERRFTALEKSLKIFQKDVFDFEKKIEELVKTAFSITEDIAEFYQEKKNQQEVDQFRSTHRTIRSDHWDSFKQTLERSVHSPMKLLLLSFRGPTNLIQKRYDKLLDYESALSKMEKNKDATKIKMLQDNQTMAKNTYEALNSQLLDDLPKLCDLSVEILYDCIRCFLKAKKSFVGRTTKLLFSLMDLPLLLGGSEGGSILSTFQVKHTLVLESLSGLTLLPKEMQSGLRTDTLKRNSSPRGSGRSFSRAATAKSQSPEQRVHVKSCYPHGHLYSACENFDGVDVMDISLKKGDVVGVVKQQDPMGNKLRWFVDNGEVKGFVPAKCLVKFLLDSSPQWSTCLDPPLAAPSANRNGATNDRSISVPQPVRPAPPVAPSLRVVAPSRYPPTPDRNAPLLRDTVSQEGVEPMHRYEEIPEHPNTESSLGHPPPATNLIAEFDPYSTVRQRQALYDNVPDDGGYRYEDIPAGHYDQVPTESETTHEEEYYYGKYDFLPTGPNQLPLHVGQVVLAIHKCDLNSNAEWWFVEDRRGNRGFVPAAYLDKYSPR